LLQHQDALLKLGDALPRGLLKVLNALLRGGELALKNGGVVRRDKLSLLGLGHILGLGRPDGRVLKDNPEPRLVVDKPGLLVGVEDALLEVGHGATLVPVVKVDVGRVVAPPFLVRLGDKVHVIDLAQVKMREHQGYTRLRDIRKHIGHKEAELLIDGRHG